jgi:hypothetical protein
MLPAMLAAAQFNYQTGRSAKKSGNPEWKLEPLLAPIMSARKIAMSFVLIAAKSYPKLFAKKYVSPDAAWCLKYKTLRLPVNAAKWFANIRFAKPLILLAKWSAKNNAKWLPLKNAS